MNSKRFGSIAALVRRAVIGGAALSGALLSSGAAFAAGYPEHPVHFIVGYAPGGGIDFIGRLISDKLSQKWGTAVVVDNKAGADGALAESFIAHAAPDGYTIGFILGPHTILPFIRDLNYSFTDSFAPIILLEQHPNVIVVNPAYTKVNTLKELIALAASKPGALSYGTSGIADADFLAMALLMQATKTNMVNIPYRGTSQMVVALMGGEIQVIAGTVTSVSDQVKTGNLRALAITSANRTPAMPDVPTVREAADLPDYAFEGTWDGIVAPKGTPDDVVAKLNADINDVLKMPDVKERLAMFGLSPIGGAPADLSDRIKSETAKWPSVVKDFYSDKK